MTEAPSERVDPPAMFTGFIMILLVVLLVFFVWGLMHQGLNLNLFPSGGIGSMMNLVFLGCLGLVLFMLTRFWISWTFLETIQYFALASKHFIYLVLPISLAANYAFVHIKKN